MSHPGSAPCPPALAAGEGGRPSVVVVQILSVKPNTDLEGDDDYVPYYDNHADIYGTVTIDGEDFDLPLIDDSDYPHWETLGPRSGVFEKEVNSSPVQISIDIWEGDSGATFKDDHVDINSAAGKYRIDFEFDLCSLTVSGDVHGSPQSMIESSGGSGSDAATILFTVGLKDARPVTDNDLALVDFDLIQVVPRSNRLVAGKGTVAMVRIANNYHSTINTNLQVRVSGGGVSVNETVPIQIGPGEVKKEYLFTSNPIIFPPSTNSYPIAVMAKVDDPGSERLPSDSCLRMNDGTNNRITWKVVTTRDEFSMLWAKVGTLLDVANYVPDTHFDELFELGAPYIETVFPLRNPVADKSPIPIPPPPVTTASDWLLTVLSAFQFPLDFLEPVIFLFELSSLVPLTGYDRLLGVLPNKDWFERFSGWERPTGFSLGEFAPHAVIFEPRGERNGVLGPKMTLPAHELGHTFGLSTDARLKSSWVCEFDWPVVGHAACGLRGGFDEYKHSDPALKEGNPSSGYWVATGNEPAALQPFANNEQCDSHCLMGGSRTNAHLNWPQDGRWIDPADYSQLIDKLAIHSDPELIYVSGMISWRNDIYLGPWFRFGEGIPDHPGVRGMYGFRFLDEGGATLDEVGLPVAWNHAEFRKPLPVTFFGMTLEFPRGSKTVEVWNRGTGDLLATREVDLSVPEVRLSDPIRADDEPFELRWTARDRENSDLTYVVLLSQTGERWWPAAYGLKENRLAIDRETLAGGEYLAKVLAINSIRVGTSEPVGFNL
jgi:hypothetical protein